MSKYYIGFTFTDNLWADGERGEIVRQDAQGRWEVSWTTASGYPSDNTFETDDSITAMIEG